MTAGSTWRHVRSLHSAYGSFGVCRRLCGHTTRECWRATCMVMSSTMRSTASLSFDRPEAADVFAAPPTLLALRLLDAAELPPCVCGACVGVTDTMLPVARSVAGSHAPENVPSNHDQQQKIETKQRGGGRRERKGTKGSGEDVNECAKDALLPVLRGVQMKTIPPTKRQTKRQGDTHQ